MLLLLPSTIRFLRRTYFSVKDVTVNAKLGKSICDANLPVVRETELLDLAVVRRVVLEVCDGVADNIVKLGAPLFGIVFCGVDEREQRTEHNKCRGKYVFH